MENWPYAEEPEEIKVGWRTIIKKVFVDPNGNRMEAFTKDKLGARSIAVIALTAENMVVVNEMFRPGPEKVMYEIPGGGANDGDEKLEQAAARELKEETGYSAESMEYLGVVYKDAWSNSENHYFLAHNCKKTSEQELDEEEFIAVHEITINQFFKNAQNAMMTDIDAVFLAHDTLRNIEERDGWDEKTN